MNHRPEWFNMWNQVDVTLSTPDAGSLTEKDLKLAEAIDRIAASPIRTPQVSVRVSMQEPGTAVRSRAGPTRRLAQERQPTARV